MNVKFATRGADVDTKLRDYMEGKVEKLEKFFGRVSDAQVTVSANKNVYSVEVTANANGVILRGKEDAQDMRKAFDLALKNLEKQIKRRSGYLKDKAQYKHGDEVFSFNIEGIVSSAHEPEEEQGIVRVKKIPIRPMDAEEAIMQMDLLGHEFFMFLEAESGKVNVVYRRKNGGYGQIQPIE